MKKILSTAFIACLCTCLLMGNSAHATVSGVFPDVPMDADYAVAVETLAAAGIVKGDAEGKFNPDSSITRAEVAAMICRLRGVEKEAAGISKSLFTDVPSSHWAVGYVAKAAELEIINGYGDKNFGPGDSVTYEQLVKMLVCFCNFREQAEAIGGYPDGYLSIADTLGITQGTTTQRGSNITRATAAILMYNAKYQ